MTMSPQSLGSRSFILLLLATVFAFFGYALLLSVVPLWAVHGGAGELAAGTTTTVFMAATVLAQLVTPRAIERIGYRAVFVLGSVLLGAPAPLHALSSAWGLLLVVAALRGIGFGLVTVSGSALVAELLPRNLHGRGSGLYGIAVGVPQIVGLPAGVWLAHNVGFELVFALAGVLPVLAVVPALLLPRQTVHAPQSEATAPAAWTAFRALLTPCLIMVLVAHGYGAIVTFLPIALGSAKDTAAVVLFALSAAMLIGRWLSGVLGDRMQSAGHQLPWGIVLASSGLGLVAVAAHFPESAAPLAIAGGAALGAGFGVLQNDSLVVMFHRVDRTRYGFASAIWNAGYDTGTGLGAITTGAMLSFVGYAPAFLIAAGLLVSMLPSAMAGSRRAESSRLPPESPAA